MALFENQAEDDAERALGLVEDTIRGLGIDPATSRVESDGSPRFALRRGSASIVVAIHPPTQDAEGSLRVVAPVIRLPAEDKRNALYERLLAANVTQLRGVAFGISGEDVVIVAERGLRDLDASEVEVMVRSVGRAADRFDDSLSKAFDTTRSSDGS